MTSLTVDELRHALSYDPETGVFTWHRPAAHNVKAGQRATAKCGAGYGHIMVKRRRYKAHVLAWLYVHGEWPTGVVDHINGIKDDNRISNLRLATRSLNAANSARRSCSTSGFKGVTACKKRWRAQITVNQRVVYLGLYATKEAAHAAYANAARLHFGEFARLE